MSHIIMHHCECIKGKGKGIAVCETSPHLYGKSCTNGITQCYLPPGRGDFPAFTPAEAGTLFSDPEGMQGWVDLGTMGVNSLPKTVTRQRRDCDSNPFSSEPESGTLTTRPPSHPGMMHPQESPPKRGLHNAVRGRDRLMLNCVSSHTEL